MGYQGRSNYEERDRLFERSFQDKPVDKTQVKKSLDNLFAPKAADPCRDGHAWIRDWDGKPKCARCKIPKPTGTSTV